MLQRRYPHATAGKLAAAAFILVGFASGAIVGSRVPHGPGWLPGAIVWALITASVAYLVFSSEGPARRPESGWQAGLADGLIAGIIAGGIGSGIDILVASGTSISGSTVLATVGAGIGLTALIGSATGLILGLHPALLRVPSTNKRRGRQTRPRPATAARARPAIPHTTSAGTGATSKRKAKRR